ncbi:MAG TPA: ParB N-terminal domain-containing protein [Candidatus Binatia bacterium]|nr:ParB N-terminal domain-containing protein [Candidatus Binatia bacterium]
MSGHHRDEAANRAGLTAVPCWVKEMSDDEALMLLVLSNA